MDDLPDKLRRNVVVLSAAIVAITVFHLSFRPTGTLRGFAQVGNVTPLKVWLALTAVLIYVFFRYWFDEQTNTERSALATEFENRRFASITSHLKRDAERYLLVRGTPRYLLDFDDFADTQLARFADRGRLKQVTTTTDLERSASAPWRGTVRFSFSLLWADGKHYQGAYGRSYPFQFPRYIIARVIVRCALGTATYSKSAVDTLVPIGLAALAFGLCLVQLVMAGMRP